MRQDKVCPTCGKELPASALVCPHDGAILPRSSTRAPKFGGAAMDRTQTHVRTDSTVIDARGLASLKDDETSSTVIRAPQESEGTDDTRPRAAASSGKPHLRPPAASVLRPSPPRESRHHDRTVLDARPLPDFPPADATPPVAPAPLSPVLTNAEGKDPLIGARLGEYKVEERIGHGGMGIVYKGRHPLIGKPVAIKVLRREVAQDPEHVQRLLAEARAVNAIRHRGVIDIFGFGELPSGQPYVVMEFLDGVSIDRIISERAPLPALEVLNILEDLLGGLSAAHAAGVIHRDLKPNNLFVVQQPDGTKYVKILDFGLSKKSALPHSSTPQTRLNAVVGTPEYMAPEQARALPVSPLTDLYSLGVVLFEMLTGKLPFEAPSPVELLMKHVEAPPPKVSSRVPSVPAELDAIVSRLLEKAPEKRPPSAEALSKEVRRLRQKLTSAATQVRGTPAKRESPGGTGTQVDTVDRAQKEKEVSALDPLDRTNTALDADLGKLDLTGSWQERAEGFWRRQSPRHRLLAGAAVVAVLLLGGGLVWRLSADEAAAPSEPPTANLATATAADAVTRAWVLGRIGRLEKALQARVSAGRTPSPEAMDALEAQRARAQEASDTELRGAISRSLDDWERRFLSDP